jgi:hypothetical protein
MSMAPPAHTGSSLTLGMTSRIDNCSRNWCAEKLCAEGTAARRDGYFLSFFGFFVSLRRLLFPLAMESSSRKS